MSTRRRRWVVALALVAMLFGGLRSLCDAAGANGSALHAAMVGVSGVAALGHEPQSGSDAPDCCASAESAAPAMVLEPWLPAVGSGNLAAFLVVILLATVPFSPRALPSTYRLVPRSPSFYLRSARVLR